MWLEISGLILLIAICFHCYIRCGRVGKLLDKLPGPYAWPVLGNTFHYFINFDRIWPRVLSDNKKYRPIYKVWAPHWGVVNILHPDDIEILLSSTKHIEKSIIYSFLHRWLGEGLLTSKGDKWQIRRKILTPAFHFNILQRYLEIISNHGVKMVNFIKSEDNEVVLNLEKFFTKYTLSTICETAMGTPIDEMSNTADNFREAVHTVGAKILRRFLRLWPLPDWFYYHFIPTGIAEKKAVQFLHDFSLKIINERKQYHKKTGGKFLDQVLTNETDEHADLYLKSSKIKRKKLAMLDLLIAASRDGIMDDKGILEEVHTFIFEGNDTTTSALTYTIQLLAEHTEIQENARKEIREIWNSCNGKFNITDVNKLSFLDRCVKESLRLFPSVPFISRVLRDDLQLTNYLIPAGVLIQIMINDLHHLEEFWPEPGKFNPDRFLPKTSGNRHPFSYIPFSAGPRNCIGQKLAMLEIKTFCAYILRHFRLEALRSCLDFDIKPDLIYRPVKPFFVKFIPIAK